MSAPTTTAHETRAPLFIGGSFEEEGASGDWHVSINPANEEEVGAFAVAGAADVARAVEAARRGQKEWVALGAQERAARLHTLADRLSARTQDIIALETRDTGNTIRNLARDVTIAANNLRYFAGLGVDLNGETTPASAGNLHLTVHEPYGVVGRIVPFNHPFMFAAARIAAPLAAGNAVIVKTPEQSPLSSNLLAEATIGVLPDGVLNIVHGFGRDAGDAIVRHPAVKRIGFTGSVPTGMAIQRAAAEVCVKHISLELGGKNPMIVFPDANPASAADLAIAGMNFSWAGQSCGSTSRLLVHDSIYDQVVAGVCERAEALLVGDPLDPASDMGPVNNKAHYEKVLSYVEIAKRDGATLAAGGVRPAGPIFERGYWIRPTLFTNVTMDMRIAREEVFGPILSILRWRTEDEVVAMANGTEFGLTASLVTNDLNAAMRTARALEAGYVWINGCSTHFLGAPFSGKKNSGVGSEESREELLSYTEFKSIHVMVR